MKLSRAALPLLLAVLASTAFAQQSTPLRRIEGIDAATGIAYTRILLPGRLVSPSSAPGFMEASFAGAGAPTLIAQCTHQSSGKQGFELFLSLESAASDLEFRAPLQPSPEHPRPQRVSLSMDLSGYTHIDGMRRQWEDLREPSGLFRYAAPGFHSSNLDDAPILMRYLVALPTLRLSVANRSALFETSPLLTEIRSEPLCKASLL